MLKHWFSLNNCDGNVDQNDSLNIPVRLVFHWIIMAQMCSKTQMSEREGGGRNIFHIDLSYKISVLEKDFVDQTFILLFLVSCLSCRSFQGDLILKYIQWIWSKNVLSGGCSLVNMFIQIPILFSFLESR